MRKAATHDSRSRDGSRGCAPGTGPAGDPPPFGRGQAGDRRGGRGLEGGLPDAERRADPDGVRHRCHGGRGRQHRASRRQGAGAERGALRGAVGKYLQGLRHQRGDARDRMGPAGGPRAGRPGAAAASRHGLRHGDAERDVDRHGPSGRGDRPGGRRDAGGLRRRRDLGDRSDGVPDRRVGHRPALRRLAEGPDAAAGPGVRVGQPQGVGEDRRVRLAQLLLQPQGRPEEGQGVRHALHAGPHAHPGPPRSPCGGSRTRGWRASGSGIAA